MAVSVLPILALVLGVALLGSKSAKASPATNGSSNGGGPGPGPGPGPVGPGPGEPPPPPPHNLELPALFTVRSGDLPAGVAAYYGGSIGDLQGENPGLMLATAAQQAATGWNIGKKVILPGDWRPFSKPLPKTGSFNPKPMSDIPANYPEPL